MIAHDRTRLTGRLPLLLPEPGFDTGSGKCADPFLPYLRRMAALAAWCNAILGYSPFVGALDIQLINHYCAL